MPFGTVSGVFVVDGRSVMILDESCPNAIDTTKREGISLVMPKQVLNSFA
jgi:hypothetical protein